MQGWDPEGNDAEQHLHRKIEVAKGLIKYYANERSLALRENDD